ncbi:MAG: amidase [Bacteroidales bacterium]|nr:amidase [Bacteroidales bacterium]
MKRIKRILMVCLVGMTCVLTESCIRNEVDRITAADVNHAQKLIGMEFSRVETDSMLTMLNEQLKNYENMRKVKLPNNVPPAFEFNPIPVGKRFETEQKPPVFSDYSGTLLPADMHDLAFYSIGQLYWLIHSKQISSEQLTQFFLDRLKQYSPMLNCVVTFTDSLAFAQAKQADRELASGKDRGLLHGIPFGIKDMFYTKNYRTTFGSPPFENQLVDEDATVVERLRDAGAVMIAKLSLGELAMDDVWFGGKTRNPWDTTKGSSGSSAGPASAVSAGLVPFAIGSETWGSIVSPSTVCGVTGLRPTYGRISRNGAMALSWTMDKIGPLCRNAEDCAIVLDAIYGPDGKDQTVFDIPFNYSPEIDFSELKIGVITSDFNQDSTNKAFNEAALIKLKEMGATLIPVQLPGFPYMDMSILLMCEAASAFDDLTLSNRDDLMVQQAQDRWPNLFRAAHFIPATEYIRANRLRYLMVQQMDALISQYDVIVAPSHAGDNLLATNLSGHPSVVLPNGFLDEKTPVSIVFTGQLFGEGKLIAVAKKYQDATGFQKKHPPMF